MLSGLVARVRSLWNGIWRRDDVESDMAVEFRHHIEQRAADLMRSGATPEEAMRRAKVEFGGVEHHREEARASRGLGGVDQIRFSWLDFKLGGRMLARYPGLTFVGGFAMAFAIWVGAGTFEFLTQVVNPKLPFRDGERIVALQNYDPGPRNTAGARPFDFVLWHRELRSVEELGAWRQLDRNLIIGSGAGEPVALAEISASAFRITAVRPLLGRVLLDSDEAPAAPAVVVIGHNVWQSRFGADSSVVGRTVRLGATLTTIVGVMPEGFAFPISHDVWIPFHLNADAFPPGQGPGLTIFGRLTDASTIASAQLELSVLGQRVAAESPDTHEQLRPRVLPYAKSYLNIEGYASLGVRSSNLLLVLLLGLICMNVALLIFARAATRESEIVVRSALGASRGRIVTQLFAEALVLAAVSAAVGLGAASFGLEWAFNTVIRELMNGARLPFWFHSDVSVTTIAYTILLALLAAVVAGVLPALKVTRGLAARLRATGTGGGGLSFGGVWTGVIVAQVALTTVFPVIAFGGQRETERTANIDLGFDSRGLLAARVAMDRESPSAPDDTTFATFRQRFATSFATLERQLESQPGVTAVTYVNRLPRTYHGWHQVEVDEGAIAPRDSRGHRPSLAMIDPDYFEALGAQVRAGRRFHSGDTSDEARTVIVNEPFVASVLGGKNPLGRRIRFISNEWARSSESEGPWYEIVGVVADLGTPNGYGRAGVYRAVGRDQAYPTHLIMRVSGDAAAFTPMLRSMATAVDPTLRLYSVMPLSQANDREIEFYRFWYRLTFAMSAVALLLSLAGIYSVMAFTVARRSREIGIRVALGSDPRRVAFAIFRRPLIQVAAGVLIGTAVIAGVFMLSWGSMLTLAQFGMIAAYGTVMAGICLLACVVPTRRALRIEPTDALRMDV